MKRILLCITYLCMTQVWAGIAAQINQTALATQIKENLYIKDKKVYLYGYHTNGADTKNGDWACAKVVSIILIKAGVSIPMQLGVAGIENSLKSWKKITNSKDLLPGDVVVWTSRMKGNKDCSCTGSGTCHVGVYTDKGYFHNNPLGYSPVFNGIGLWGCKFKVAFRAPN